MGKDGSHLAGTGSVTLCDRNLCVSCKAVLGVGANVRLMRSWHAETAKLWITWKINIVL